MGAVELQVFVSLVVILGAAFVALICDFLKGNNEQLRESNIELKVRHDESERREALVERVQRQTLEAVARTRVAATATAKPAPPPRVEPLPAPVAEQVAPVADARALFEQAEQDRRRAARRERRRMAAPPPPSAESVPVDPPDGAAWAQQVYLKRYPQPAAHAVEPVAPAEPAVVAEALPVVEPPAVQPVPKIVAEPELSTAPAPVADLIPVEARPCELAAQPSVTETAASSPEPVCGEPAVPVAELELQTPVIQMEETPEPASVQELAALELNPLALPLAVESLAPRLEPVATGALPEAAGALAETQPRLVSDLLAAWPLPLNAAPVAASGPVPALVAVMAEAAMPRLELALEVPMPEFSPMADELADAPADELDNVVRIRVLSEDDVSVPADQPVTVSVAAEPIAEAPDEDESVEARSNVFEMRAQPVSAPPPTHELAIPGGFHDSEVLARLLADEAPFHGLAIAISPVEYVRLLAELGKPAMEQLMGSISRMVVAMTREQDFACRIAEDEFLLLFAKETGAAAKRRTQLVTERLWDFQLRSLGNVSVTFGWGAMESTTQTLARTVEAAREHMLETRSSRRLTGRGLNRFHNRLAM
jgi:hypothetical protein